MQMLSFLHNDEEYKAHFQMLQFLKYKWKRPNIVSILKNVEETKEIMLSNVRKNDNIQR